MPNTFGTNRNMSPTRMFPPDGFGEIEKVAAEGELSVPGTLIGESEPVQS